MRIKICCIASIEEAASYALVADALLLDSGEPDAVQRTLGGTGRVHDWETSREIVEGTPLPVFLAGGLDPDNVGEAIRRARPAGVDVCSSLRPLGPLDPAHLAAFVRATREAVDSTCNPGASGT